MPSTQILTVLDDLARVAGATTPEQDQLPTPCAGFDVIALRRHLLGGIQYFTVVLADPAGDQRPDPHTFVGSDEPGALSKSVNELAAAARTALVNGVEATSVNVAELAAGAIPGDRVIGLLLAETVVHGWDLARATGQPWQPDPAASERAQATLAGAIEPEYRGGDGMPFAPELPVDADAPALERLVAFAGRSVDWAPAV